METKKIVGIIAAAVFIFTLGVTIGSSFSFQQSQGTASGGSIVREDSFQAGWEAAKKRLVESGFIFPMMNQEIKAVDGEVRQVEGNKIALKIRPLEPLADPALDDRIAVADSNTKIYQYVEKDREEFQKEMELFNKKMQARAKALSATPTVPETPVMPPESRIKKEAGLSDILAGRRISVIASENIKDKKEFVAVEIVLESMPIPPISNPAVIPPVADTTAPAGVPAPRP